MSHTTSCEWSRQVCPPHRGRCGPPRHHSTLGPAAQPRPHGLTQWLWPAALHMDPNNCPEHQYSGQTTPLEMISTPEVCRPRTNRPPPRGKRHPSSSPNHTLSTSDCCAQGCPRVIVIPHKDGHHVALGPAAQPRPHGLTQ